MTTRHPRNIMMEISKRNDMHFVYAFFFQFGDNVHVKVGESTTPYRRLGDIVHGSPFPVTQAVFCHAGPKSVARAFEELVRHALAHARTRGEWYVFHRDAGREFRAAIATSFAKSTGRVLKWTRIDLAEFARENGEAAARWQGRWHGKGLDIPD